MHLILWDKTTYTQLATFREASVSKSQEHQFGCEWVLPGAQLGAPST